MSVKAAYKRICIVTLTIVSLFLVGFSASLFAFWTYETPVNSFSRAWIAFIDGELIFWAQSGGGHLTPYGVFRYDSALDAWENISDVAGGPRDGGPYVEAAIERQNEWGAEFYLEYESRHIWFAFFDRSNQEDHVSKTVQYPVDLWLYAQAPSFKFLYTPSRIWFYPTVLTNPLFLGCFDTTERRIVSGFYTISYEDTNDGFYSITCEAPDGVTSQYQVPKISPYETWDHLSPVGATENSFWFTVSEWIGDASRTALVAWLDPNTGRLNIVEKEDLKLQRHPGVAAVKEHEGLLMIGTCESSDWGRGPGEGLFIYNPATRKWTNLTVDNSGIAGDGVLDILPTKDAIWLATTGGVSRYDRETGKCTNYGMFEGRAVKTDSPLCPIYSLPHSDKPLTFCKGGDGFEIRSLWDDHFKVCLKEDHYGWVRKNEAKQESDSTISLAVRRSGRHGRIFTERDTSSSILLRHDYNSLIDNTYSLAGQTDDWYKVKLPYGWVKTENFRPAMRRMSVTRELGLSSPVRVSPEGEYFMHPEWSPSGRWIAATRARLRGIYLLDPFGRDTTARELTDEYAAGFGFLWSRDSKSITYSTRGVYKSVDINTGEIRTLVDPKKRGTGAVVTDQEDGASVAYLDSSLRLWCEIAGKTRLVAEDGGYLWATMSPDGRAVLADKIGVGMFVFELSDTSGPVKRVALGEGTPGAWSPDGKRILFHVAREGGLDILGSELFIVNRDGTGRVQLTDTPDKIELDPCWSPDGRRLAYRDHSSRGIYVATLVESDRKEPE